MAPLGAKREPDKGPAEMIGEIWELVRDYAKQETLDPLKAIGNFLKWGLLGATFLTLGLLFGVLAVIRGLQTETGEHLTGSFTWVPYAAGLLFALVGLGLSALSIRKSARAA